jgi:hypothetical protein
MAPETKCASSSLAEGNSAQFLPTAQRAFSTVVEYSNLCWGIVERWLGRVLKNRATQGA